jgi:hypothetical protein
MVRNFRERLPLELASAATETSTTIIALGGDIGRTQDVVAFAPYLSAKHRSEAFASALAISDNWQRADTIAGLVPYLTIRQRSQALAALISINNEIVHTYVIPSLSQFLSPQQRSAALANAKAIHGEFSRVTAFARLAPYLSAEQLVATSKDVLTIVETMDDEESRANIIATFARHFIPRDRDLALSAALAIADEESRTNALIAFEDNLTTDQRDDILQTIVAVSDENDRASALRQIVPYLTNEQRNVALNAILAISDEETRVNAIMDFARYLTESQSLAVLDKIDSIQNIMGQAQVLSLITLPMAEQTRSNIIRHAVNYSKSISDDTIRTLTLSIFSRHLTTEEIDSVLVSVVNLPDFHKVSTLAMLAPHLTHAQASEALKIANAFTEHRDRRLAFISISPFLNFDQINDLLEIVKNSDTRFFWSVLVEIAPRLSDTQLRYVLDVIEKIDDPSLRARVLGRIAPYLTVELRNEVWETKLPIGRSADAIDLTALPRIAEIHRPKSLESNYAVETTEIITNTRPYMPPSEKIGDASLKQSVSQLIDGFRILVEKHGFEAVQKEIVGCASRDDRVLKADMVAAALEPPLYEHFRLRDIPKSMWSELTGVVNQTIASWVKAAMRPKWDERGKYAELKDLSSPAFLKRVYADEIAPNGSIEKEAVRKVDSKLMAAVETYISGREARQRDMGDAAGLRLVTSGHTRPKRANFG